MSALAGASSGGGPPQTGAQTGAGAGTGDGIGSPALGAATTPGGGRGQERRAEVRDGEGPTRPSVIEYATQGLKLFGALRALEIAITEETNTKINEIFPSHKTAPKNYAW